MFRTGMTGGPVFDGSLAALAPMGRIVIYGMASRRPPAPIEPASLIGTSRAVIGFWLVHALGEGGWCAVVHGLQAQRLVCGARGGSVHVLLR